MDLICLFCNLHKEFSVKLQRKFWIKHMTCTDHRIKPSIPWKHTGSWLQRHGDPVDTEEDSGNPFEGFRGKLHMQSRWVWVEGDMLATGCPLAPWEPRCWLHPTQLSLITSSQKAHCDDAIPLEAQDIPVDYPLIGIKFSFSFSWCWLQFVKSMIWLITFHYRVNTGGWGLYIGSRDFRVTWSYTHAYTDNFNLRLRPWKCRQKDQYDANMLADLTSLLLKLLNAAITVHQSSFFFSITAHKSYKVILAYMQNEYTTLTKQKPCVRWQEPPQWMLFLPFSFNRRNGLKLLHKSNAKNTSLFDCLYIHIFIWILIFIL